MAEKSVDELTAETVSKGGVLSIFYFDVHGNSEEGIRNILVDMAGKISKEKGIVYSYAEIDKSVESDGMYTTSAEIKLLVEDFQTLVNLCVLYGPIGVEVLEPQDRMTIPISELQNAMVSISSMARTYTKMALDRVLTPEQKKEYFEKINKSAEIGKRLREDKKQENKE